MKNYLFLLSLFILFILPFGCDGCGDDEEEYEFYRTIIQGESVIIDLEASPFSWSGVITTPPKHAQMYQFDADAGQDSYFYFYRAASDYCGIDTSYIKFTRIHENGSFVYKKPTYMFYTIKINTIQDTLQGN